MCVSAGVSFGMAGLLMTGGIFAASHAQKTDRRYLPMAMFPVFVGLQQALEGLVWLESGDGALQNLRLAALGYLFFVWITWPAYVPYMTARLEENKQRADWFLRCAQAGFVLGLVLYLPNFWHPDWLHVSIINHSVAYQCTYITDAVVPREVTYLIYLALIGLPPLFSSHRALKIFGAGLIISVPLTYFSFSAARISILCFFAAVMMLYIVYVIVEDKCSFSAKPKRRHEAEKTSWFTS